MLIITVAFCILSVVIQADAKSVACGRRFKRALDAVGISEKEAADILGVTRQRFNAFLHGYSALDVRRLEAMPDDFKNAYDELSLRERGGFAISPRMVEMCGGIQVVVMESFPQKVRRVR